MKRHFFAIGVLSAVFTCGFAPVVLAETGSDAGASPIAGSSAENVQGGVSSVPAELLEPIETKREEQPVAVASNVSAQAAYTHEALVNIMTRITRIEESLKALENGGASEEEFATQVAELKEDLTAAIAQEAGKADAQSLKRYEELKEQLAKLPGKADLLNAFSVAAGGEEGDMSLSRIAMIGIVTSVLAAISTLVALFVLIKIRSIHTELPHLAARPVAASSSGAQAAPAAHQGSSNGIAIARIEERVGNLIKSVTQLSGKLENVSGVSRTTSSSEEAEGAANAAATPSAQISEELWERIGSMEEAIEKLASTLTEKAEADSAAASAVAAASAAADNDESSATPLSDTIWPKVARGFETYPVWRDALSNGVEKGHREALGLASSLLEYHIGMSGLNSMDLDTFCDLVTSLGKSAYEFCYYMEVDDEDRLDAVTAILKQVKEDAAKYPGLEVRGFFPNDRLDTDLMEKVDSGNRLSVSRPISWLIMDKTPGKERVLARALVVTG